MSDDAGKTQAQAEAQAGRSEGTTLTGAQFRRQVGTDPKRWAQEFWRAWEDRGHSDDERHAIVEAWFRDAMDAATRAASLQGTRELIGETDETR